LNNVLPFFSVYHHLSQLSQSLAVTTHPYLAQRL
jgi:hypothetical protein